MYKAKKRFCKFSSKEKGEIGQSSIYINRINETSYLLRFICDLVAELLLDVLLKRLHVSVASVLHPVLLLKPRLNQTNFGIGFEFRNLISYVPRLKQTFPLLFLPLFSLPYIKGKFYSTQKKSCVERIFGEENHGGGGEESIKD